MTAEILIINRSGIALAADSAVTIGRRRVWKTTNKLFSLSPKNDIGIMVYGSGDYVGYPWDTVIKEFRRSQFHKTFDTVEDAASAFFTFLREARFQDTQSQELAIFSLFVETTEQLAPHIKFDGRLDFRKKFDLECQEFLSDINNAPICIENIEITEFVDTYGEQCVNFFKDAFEQTFTKAMRNTVHKVCFEVFRRAVASSYSTGVVVAGFGEKELLPHVRTYTVDGRDGKYLRQWSEQVRDLNTKPETAGIILPFGQADIAYLFMEGISLGQEQYIESALHAVLEAKSADLVKSYVANADEKIVEGQLQQRDDKRIVERFMEEYRSYREKRVVNPIMSVVATLPKEEMAAMAESLVDITGLRRKVDSRIESVAGPIDVAFISKGDGFIWMKRKHYFDIRMNHDFAARKHKEGLGGPDEDRDSHVQA